MRLVNDVLAALPGRISDPVRHLADATAFLVSDHASCIKGATLAVDGEHQLNKGYMPYPSRLPPRPEKRK